jgi:hypothetical protein
VIDVVDDRLDWVGDCGRRVLLFEAVPRDEPLLERLVDRGGVVIDFDAEETGPGVERSRPITGGGSSTNE